MVSAPLGGAFLYMVMLVMCFDNWCRKDSYYTNLLAGVGGARPAARRRALQLDADVEVI